MGNFRTRGIVILGLALAGAATLVAVRRSPLPDARPAASAAMTSDVALTQQAAERCAQKLRTVNANSLVEARQPRVTPFSEAEVNSYLRFRASDEMPVGVVDPYLAIEGDGRLSGRATVDLDEVKKSRTSEGWFDPMRLLSGRLAVTATAVLTSSNGKARLEIESARVGQIPVPAALLQELVTHYTATPERPDGFDLSEPFDLPMRIRAVQVGSAEALVVQ